MSDVTILGAGPAGLGAALGLARSGHRVTVLEQSDRVGGNAGSFELGGVRVDYGSHRFHPAADAAVFDLVRDLLGDDLLTRPRHGRIRLLGRWIHFPLRAVDLALRSHPRFTAGVLKDLSAKIFRGPNGHHGAPDTFATVLERGLGPTICREFYFPYAQKIWGLPPDEISPVQARRRVSSASIGALVRRLLPRGARAGGRSRKGVFYYPRHGYGQICDCLSEAAQAAGARVLLRSAATCIEIGAAEGHRVRMQSERGANLLTGRHLWSTIPVTALVRLISPRAPEAVVQAVGHLRFRSMALVYLVLATDRFTEYDAHYFPEAPVPFTRVSEPKNYAAATEPRGATVLCAEIPCNRDDAMWSKSDEELGAIVAEGLARAGIPVRCPILNVAVRRLPSAYPVYRTGYERHFGRMDDWLEEQPGILSFGRQGLFAHDNTHHALFMARSAVACLRNGEFDRRMWREYRNIFDMHVVED